MILKSLFRTKLRRSDVVAAYEMLLKRQPESEAAIDGHVRHQSFASLLNAITSSAEYNALDGNQHQFMAFTSMFDPAPVIRAHQNSDRRPLTNHRVNFLGVAMNLDFVPTLGLTAEVEDIPIPANWHACIAEWGAALRAVDLAKDRFTMIELGCGWGCWMNNTGVAARRRGLDVKLIGVEGDLGHITFAQESLTTNKFSPGAYKLHHGIASATNGRALFPNQDVAGGSWGLEPLFNASETEHAKALATGRYFELPMVALEDVIGNEPRIDLLHVDIQGGEVSLVRDSAKILSERVAFMVIGTHSRAIDGLVAEELLSKGWSLEIERPTIYVLEDGVPSTRVDGLQGWRNRNLFK